MDKKRELTPEEMSRVSGGAQQQVSSSQLRITTANVRLMQRANATASTQVVCTVPQGTTVKIIRSAANCTNWFLVDYGGQRGYVDGSYLASPNGNGND